MFLGGCMKIIKKLLTSVVLIQFSLATAAEPDFYINFSTCKNAVGYLVLSEESFKIIPGEPTVMGCFKSSEDIRCMFEFQDGQAGHKGNSENYKVVIDSPPYLHFKTQNGSEYVAIDTGQHAAVLISRVLGEQFAGSKVCHGLYTTSFEVNNLGK